LVLSVLKALYEPELLEGLAMAVDLGAILFLIQLADTPLPAGASLCHDALSQELPMAAAPNI